MVMKYFLFKLFSAIAIIVVLTCQAPPAYSLSAEQKSLYNQNILYYDLEADAGCRGQVSLSGKDNAEKIWNFLISQGFTPEQTAGFLGNFSVETGDSFDPGTEQIGGNAYGIAQWDDRRTTLETYAREKGQPVDSLELQLDFIMYELKGSESGAYSSIKAAKTVEEAWKAVSHDYERPAEPDNPERGTEAHKYYDLFKGTTSGGAGGVSECSAESGIVNTDGYAMPVNLDVVAGQLPCQAFTCHHDGTPAADLGIVEKWEGSPVYAIFAGKISNLHYRAGFGASPAPHECVSLQLEGDDGWKYWYGHVRAPKVANGQKVKAGQQLAVIGQSACADDTPPHLHIDRGSPKGSLGGSECCRDPGFIPLLNKIYKDAQSQGGKPR